MKKRKLKKTPKIIIEIILSILIVCCIIFFVKNYAKNTKNFYEECDNQKKYKCSYYEAKKYNINK
ncbi:MAG: hypothetical protein RSB77_06250 [Bacilli bacterium]